MSGRVAGSQDSRDDLRDARWRPAAIPLAVWALLLGSLAGVQGAFGGHLLPVLVQGGAAALIAVVALAIVLAPRIARRGAPGLRTVPVLSIASALAAVSIAAILDGASIGSWLIIGGVLGLALAAGGLVREHRAEHRARRAATDAPVIERRRAEGRSR